MTMINEEIFTQLVINETCYEDNCDEFGTPYWKSDDIRDPDELIEIVSRFWLMAPAVKGLRRGIYTLEDHPILWGEVISLINTMDLDELADKVQDEIDDCNAYWDAKRMAMRYY